MPCMFETQFLTGLAHTSQSGQHNLVVLGAQPAASGQMLLESEEVVNQFTDRSSEFFGIIFVANDQAQLPVDDSPGHPYCAN